MAVIRVESGRHHKITNLVAPDLIRSPGSSCARSEKKAGPRIESGVTKGVERSVIKSFAEVRFAFPLITPPSQTKTGAEALAPPRRSWFIERAEARDVP